MATVLIVEDNPANMKLATFLLESAGHTVLSAKDAEAGLTMARTQHPNLILMDIQLPGMDGLAATALEVLGPTLQHAEPADAAENGFWQETYLYSRAASVYGGTQQIQRNIIADRILALPQE